MFKLRAPKIKLFNKRYAIWIITVILCTGFFIVNIPRSEVQSIANPESSGYIYGGHGCPNKQNGICGALENQAGTIEQEIGGVSSITGVSATGQINYEYNGGIIGYIANVSDTMYESPTGSAIIWAQDQYNQMTGKGSYTAMAYNPNDTSVYSVSGYQALQGTIGLWSWSRNIVYAFFVVILIAVAFMILFRRTMGGQQYITLTNSLPSIVLSLVLITFSYPISAAFIDAVSIGCNVAYNVIMASPNSPGYSLVNSSIVVPKIQDTLTPTTVTDINGTVTPTTLYGQSYSSSPVPIRNVLQPDDQQMSLWSIFYTANAKVCGNMPMGDLSFAPLNPFDTSTKCNFEAYTLPAAVNSKISSTFSFLLNVVDALHLPNAFIELAIFIFILTVQLKIFKRIFTDYLILSFFPILSPWLFLVAAMPNRTGKVLGDYVKILGWSAANLVIIYACFLILIVLGYSSDATGTGVSIGGSSTTFQLSDSFKQSTQLNWLPPMLGYSYGQIIGNGDFTTENQQIISTLVIIFFFAAIPRIPEEIQNWLSVPQLPPLLRNTGQDVAAGFKQAASGMGGATAGFIGKRFNKGE